MKKLIITGDDFGLARSVNEAIETAHRRGILTTASLMVGAGAAADAVARARELPSLRVGLHLVLVGGSSISPPHAVPDLVNQDGRFSSHLVRAGIHFFFRPGVRRQLETEIRAQFQAFKETGLSLDHVNAHQHMHLHPTVLGLILKVGREYGLEAVRLPYEPCLLSWRASRSNLFRKLSVGFFLFPWIALTKIRLRQARVRFNDALFGMNDTGNMHPDLVLRFLTRLPEGVTEIYFHPAVDRCPEIDATMPNYHHQDELEALISPAIQRRLLASRIQRIAFSDL